MTRGERFQLTVQRRYTLQLLLPVEKLFLFTTEKNVHGSIVYQYLQLSIIGNM